MPAASALNGRQLCFMHIGKTAGTSFFHLLRDNLNDLRLYHASPEAFDKATSREIEKYDLVAGHFSFVHTAKFRHDRYLATFLRDPVERVLSNYYFLRHWDGLIDDSNRIMVERAKALTLKQFLESTEPQVQSVTVNHQAYFLASDFRAPREIPDDRLLEQALANLQRVNFVGLTEDYGNCVAMFFADIGRPKPDKLHVMNVTPERIRSLDLGPEERELICRLNRVDMEIYRVVKENHDRKLKEFATNRGTAG